MKYSVSIAEITKEELIDLFSTALTGSFWLQIDVPTNEQIRRVTRMSSEETDTLTIEDKMALWVLNGLQLRFEDMNAQNKEDLYGNLGKWDKDLDCAYYMIGLNEIRAGLERAAIESDYLRECFNYLADGERTNLDQCDAEALMQVIMFGELVYG